MEKCLIVARAKNKVIGSQGDMPWHFPEDLKHFKKVTTGYPIIMGSRTYDSIGKPLPNRLNIVLSSKNLIIEGAEVVKSLDEAYKLAELTEMNKVFIIGGASVYRQAMETGIDKAYITEINQEFEGDTFFEYDFSNWDIEAEENVPDEKGSKKLTFITYKNKPDQ